MSRRSARLPINLASQSHYTIAPAGRSWSITIQRNGVAEIIPAVSFPEALRIARPLSDAGLVGMVVERTWSP